MPVLVMAAQLCPEGVEATLFASLMSVMNAASATGEALGAGLTALLGVAADNFTNLFWLVLICNLLSLFPLAFVGLVPGEAASPDGEDVREEDVRRGESMEGAKGAGNGEPMRSAEARAIPVGMGWWFQWLLKRRGSSIDEVEEKRALMAEIEMQR
jgi:hypothetical protein